MSLVSTLYKSHDFWKDFAEIADFTYVKANETSAGSKFYGGPAHIEINNHMLYEKICEVEKEGLKDFDLHVDHTSPDGFNRFYIPAKFCREFFIALFLPPKGEGKNELFMQPQFNVQKILKDLVEDKFLTQEESEFIYKKVESTIPRCLDTTIRTREYIDSAKKNKDPYQASVLALYYNHYKRKDTFYDAISWICLAKDYCGNDKLLGDLIDLKQFFQAYNEIPSRLFNEGKYNELLFAAASCGTINTLSLNISRLTKTSAQSVAYFIEQALSLKNIYFEPEPGWNGSYVQSSCLNHLIRSLEKSKSVNEFVIRYMGIGKEKINEIIKVIRKNRQMPISKLSIVSCANGKKLSDANVQQLVKLINERQSLKIVEVDPKYQKFISNKLEHRDIL